MQLLIPCVIMIECFPHLVMSSVVETSLRHSRLRLWRAFMRFLGRAKRAELERSMRYA